MNTFSVCECVALLQENNQKQPKAKYSNNILLSMLATLNPDTKISVEPTKAGFAINRGSLCENIVKIVLGVQASKTAQNQADIDLAGVDKKAFEIPVNAKKLEIKFATTFAPATANATKTKWVLLVCPDGAFIIDTANHTGRYTNTSCWEGQKLEKLSKVLGF